MQIIKKRFCMQIKLQLGRDNLVTLKQNKQSSTGKKKVEDSSGSVLELSSDTRLLGINCKCTAKFSNNFVGRR